MIGIAPGLPMLHWPDHTICELAFSVFDWLQDQGFATGTLRRLAFDLRHWLAFCLRHHWDPERPDDARLSAWKTFLTTPDCGGLGPHRANAKVARIFGMYRILHLAMPWKGDSAREPAFLVIARKGMATKKPSLGDSLGGRPAQEPAATGSDAANRLSAVQVGKGLAWLGARRGPSHSFLRPIPTERQCRELLARLRGGVAGGGEADYPRHLSERDWMMGRAMEGAGCRAHEVSRLDLNAVLEMLEASKLVPRVPKDSPAIDVGPGGLHRLDALAADPKRWGSLLNCLEALAKQETISLPITGKNDKRRLAPVAIDFVHDLLEHIASNRPAQLAAWRKSGWRGDAPIGLFLSDKTKDSLTAGSISDLLAKAFSFPPAVSGSGHRLRAFYGLRTAIRLFGDLMKRFHGEISETMIEEAYIKLAQALGHSKITTTLKHYVDLALAFRKKVAGHRNTALMSIEREMANIGGQLDDRKLEILLKTVRKLIRAELGSEYMGLLEDILAENISSLR